MLSLTIWFLLAFEDGRGTLVAAFSDQKVCWSVAKDLQKEHGVSSVCKPGEYILKGQAS